MKKYKVWFSYQSISVKKRSGKTKFFSDVLVLFSAIFLQSQLYMNWCSHPNLEKLAS